MADPDEGEPILRTTPDASVRDHLANERTLLAWQRTALGVIGIGFLVHQFALDAGEATLIGSVAGIGLVVLGAVVSTVGARRFLRTEREIDMRTYRPAVLAHIVLTVAIVVAAGLIASFLIVSID